MRRAFAPEQFLMTAKAGKAPASRRIVDAGTFVTTLVIGGEEVFLRDSREIVATQTSTSTSTSTATSVLGKTILGLKVDEETAYGAALVWRWRWRFVSFYHSLPGYSTGCHDGRRSRTLGNSHE